MESVDTLLAMSDAQVRERANSAAAATEPGLPFWLNELQRRQNAKSARHMLWLTRIAVASAVGSLVFAVASFVLALRA